MEAVKRHPVVRYSAKIQCAQRIFERNKFNNLSHYVNCEKEKLDIKSLSFKYLDILTPYHPCPKI